MFTRGLACLSTWRWVEHSPRSFLSGLGSAMLKGKKPNRGAVLATTYVPKCMRILVLCLSIYEFKRGEMERV